MLSDGEKRKKVFKIHREIDVVSHTTWQFHSQFTSVYSVKYRLFCRIIHFIFGIFVFIINFCKMWAIYCLDEIFENRKKTIEIFFVIVRSIGENFFRSVTRFGPFLLSSPMSNFNKWRIGGRCDKSK